uniref:3'-5' exoribonuclease Rv2179c-like domain-containing protein n=1 Tax=viral metagenome TaxID=1070528 RepID=A0A6M3J379_9ZZZZ
MQHVMLDLETMGSSSNAAITAIGACFFDLKTGEIGKTYERIVHLRHSARYGKIDADTVLWWLRQSEEARKKLDSPDAVSLTSALTEFSEFINLRNVKVWGNGASFDCTILKNAYEALDRVAPWAHWNERDVRTMVDLGRDIAGFDPKKDMPFNGVRHSALDDAIHQAKYVSAIYQRLKPAA